MDTLRYIGLSAIFAIVGAVVGVLLVLASTLILPHLVNRLTPTLDEEKEIARGNQAAGEYFGRIVAACILGVSIIIAAAILGGLIAAFC
jgi:uncharacterized membrane protein YjfL (UPF0719 family)